MLLIPSLYFHRVDEVLKEADMTPEEIAYSSILTSQRTWNYNEFYTQMAKRPYDPKDPPLPLPSYEKLQVEWKNLIDDFVEEWRTLNVVTAILIP
jgi:hypothetical protein